jgi:hypothetical protein
MHILEKGLSYQRLILVVQKKSHCLVSKTGLSSFHGFKPHWTELTPSPFFLTSLSHTRTTMRVTLRPPLAIPWFLRGILEFFGEINYPRTGVSVPPTGFPHLKVFSSNPRSLSPWMDLKFLWCIVFIHVIEQSPAISPSFLG